MPINHCVIILKVHSQATYTLPRVLYAIFRENSTSQLIIAYLRQVEAEVQLRGLRQPNQGGDLLAKQRLLLDRMLERAQIEVKILGPLSAMHWRGDSSASVEPRPSSVEGPNKSSTSARRSEGYSSCSEDILGHRLDAVLACRNW